jgi:hypothetical protein
VEKGQRAYSAESSSTATAGEAPGARGLSPSSHCLGRSCSGSPSRRWRSRRWLLRTRARREPDERPCQLRVERTGGGAGAGELRPELAGISEDLDLNRAATRHRLPHPRRRQFARRVAGMALPMACRQLSGCPSSAVVGPPLPVRAVGPVDWWASGVPGSASVIAGGGRRAGVAALSLRFSPHAWRCSSEDLRRLGRMGVVAAVWVLSPWRGRLGRHWSLALPPVGRAPICFRWNCGDREASERPLVVAGHPRACCGDRRQLRHGRNAAAAVLPAGGGRDAAEHDDGVQDAVRSDGGGAAQRRVSMGRPRPAPGWPRTTGATGPPGRTCPCTWASRRRGLSLS